MTREERRTLVWTTSVLLLASLVRFGWEARPRPPILPPEPVPVALLEETRAAAARAERMATPLAPGERIDPNRAPEEEIARLPGVGPALARRILESRGEGGGFRVPADLLRVSGIGAATLARIEPFLELSDPPPVAGGGGRPTPSIGAPSAPGEGGERIDLNRAGAVELQRLPGIGPALAERILEHRGRIGRFSRPEELLDVPGIGPAVLARLLPHVGVGG